MDDALKKLQGTWNIVGLEVEGSKMPQAASAGSKIVIEGDRFTSLSMGATYEGTMTVDTSKTPHELDIHFTDGPEKGNTSHAIYEIDGDTWRLCLTVTGNTRPRAFKTAPNSGHAFETLVRQKGPTESRGSQPHGESSSSSGPSAFADVAPTVVQAIEGEWSMAECLRDGQPLDKMMLNYGKRVAKQGETATYFGPQLFSKAKYTVDDSVTPKAIDYYHTEGQLAGQHQLGIYEVEGDRIRMSFAAPGQPRPQDFKASPGDGRTITVWKKATK